MVKRGLRLMRWAVAVAVISGCATSRPDWGDSKIRPQPCCDVVHAHDHQERVAEELRSVTMDLGRYKSVQERPGQDTNLVLAVAISGGGERSANFAVGVLCELERLKHEKSNALKEIDYFSTVSGGGLAAGAYLAELSAYARAHGTTEEFEFNTALTNCCHGPGKPGHQESLKDYLKRGYHTTLLRGLLSFTDAFSSKERGDYFEKALDRYVLGRIDHPELTLTLRDIFVPKHDTNQVTLPYWIPNATVLGNGATFQFTPDVLEQYGVSHYYHDLRKRQLFCSYDLPLAVGLRASASIPVAIRPSTLQLSNQTARMFLQLADGGLADNLGVFTGLQVFKGAAPYSTKVLLVIDAYAGDGLPFDPSGISPSVPAMAVRTADISLDAWRGRYRQVIEDLGRSQGVEVIFLSFDELVANAAMGNRLESTGCYELVRASPGSSEPPFSRSEFNRKLREIREAARNIPTTLSIKPKDQEVLLAAGRLVVCLHEDLIRQKLGWGVEEVGGLTAQPPAVEAVRRLKIEN